ncbi:winged helix-turn-helix transcriptional regulator [Chryseobacterium turcicum]|uniref:Helix-turn-helix transcriptional regulator n=1 Tax=Chryseobacterium turcicum TaxID=2898076 RepID=A0A9Q3YYH6_9FLAO|nr:helix-turn-helix domain-containing protein [Chryseobacterium turcicum]MCD1118587.1 helix-turn-helix transcriptional regulator [Chryseobacterium turcicum]
MNFNTNSDNEVVNCTENFIFLANNCYAEHALKIINGKWKISLIKIIANECPKRFGVLKRELDNLAQGTLSTILKELENDGLILRVAYAEIPPRVEYKLTEKGIAFLPIIKSMEDWWLAFPENN